MCGHFTFRKGFVVATALLAGHANVGLGDTWDNSGDAGGFSAAWSGAFNWADDSEPTGTEPVFFPAPRPGGTFNIRLVPGEVAGSITFDDSYKLMEVPDGGSLTLTGAGGVITTNHAGGVEIHVPILGSSGLTHQGAGYLYVSHINTFSGLITCRGTGGLWVWEDWNLGNAANAIHFDGGRLSIYSSGSNMSTSRTITINPLTGGQIDVHANQHFTLNSALGGANAAPFAFVGYGMAHLNAGSARTGATSIRNGTVRVTHNGALGTGAVTVSDLGALRITSGLNMPNSLTLGPDGALVGEGSATYGGSIAAAASANLYLSGGGLATDSLRLINGTNPYTGGSGSRTIVVGLGKLAIARSITYSGDWQLYSGTLRLESGGATGTGTTPIVVNGATLDLAVITQSRNVTLNNGSTLAADGGAYMPGIATVASGAAVAVRLNTAGTFLLGNQPNDLTGGGGGSTIAVTASPGGVLRLNQDSNYVGNWTVGNLATVEMRHNETLGNSANSVTFDGGTLRTALAVASTRNLVAGSSGGTFDTNGMNSLFGNVEGPGTLTKSGAGKLTVNHVRAGGLAITTGDVEVAANGIAGGVSKVSALSIAPSSALRLNDNDLIVDYTGASPEFTLRDYVLRARDVGDSGIFFTRTAEDDVVLAFGEASELGITDFNGFAVDDTTVLGKYTYYGDANLDGQVTTDDYVAVDLGLGTGDSWVQGDFDLNGVVTTDDYVVVDLNLGKGTTNPLAYAEQQARMIALHTEMFGPSYVDKLAYARDHGWVAASVPEPGMLGLVGIIGLAGAGRRGRRS